MDEKREDNRESKGSTFSDKDEDFDDLRVLAVIENETRTKEEAGKTCESDENDEEEENVEIKTEVILLDEPPTPQMTYKHTDRAAINAGNISNNPRVIELSDKKSKMELRREFKVDVPNSESSIGISRVKDTENNGDDYDDDHDDGSANILSRLPPGTILIKQSSTSGGATTAETPESSAARDDSDYVHDSSKDSTGTNSSESSSTASYPAAGKVKRMQFRAVRSKKIVEVRRNPVRNKKKKPAIDEDFQRPRQRLLAAKRKSSFVGADNVTRKRVKIAPTPYMNTRSVTRKMYTVGATYQAPTRYDAIEWKEWPSHGMNERPVWHPQIGLAYEYNQRSYLSLDGEKYREIVDEPFIEVVSVDPHNSGRVSMPFFGPRPKYERVRYHNPSTIPKQSMGMGKMSLEGNSFQACMHGSFHSVLAYCARVVTPAYKKSVDMKYHGLSRVKDTTSNAKTTNKLRVLPEVSRRSQDHGKVALQTVLVPTSGAATKISDPSDQPSTSGTTDIPKCLVIPRKTIHFTNVRNIQGNILQEVFSRSSKNTLIFLKPTDPPGKTAEKIAAAIKNSSTGNKMNPSLIKDGPDPKAELNLTKLDDSAITDEALMEMSSMYNNMLPSETIELTNSKPGKTANYPTRPLTTIVATKIPNKSSNESTNDNFTIRPSYSGFGGEARMKNPDGNPRRFTYSNQAVEIAKILSDYNQTATKTSGMRNTCYTPASLNVRASTSGKNMKTFKQCSAANGRNAYLSVVEQPSKLRLKRMEDLRGRNDPMEFRNSNIVAGRGKTYPAVTATITSAMAREGKNEDGQAMDLTTGKTRAIESEKKNVKTKESEKWLEELIEDTAILYCAATGSHQEDVADYMNTLDSNESLQWLGS